MFTRKLKVSPKALVFVRKGVARDDGIAQMEEIGLSQRIINALEESTYNIIKLRQLLEMPNVQSLLAISNIGESAITQIEDCLNRYEEVEKLLNEEFA